MGDNWDRTEEAREVGQNSGINLLLNRKKLRQEKKLRL
jgi:hypothetical protein